jgi:hypothetical protein
VTPPDRPAATLDRIENVDPPKKNEADHRLGTPAVAGDTTWRIRTDPGHYLLAAARDDAPARLGAPPAPVDDTALRVWDSAFKLAVRRRFEPDSPLAEISRTVAGAVHAHETVALPVLDAEMLVRDALGEAVPVDEIDPVVRLAVHLLVFASLTDELALGDGELDGLIAQAEELAGALS